MRWRRLELNCIRGSAETRTHRYRLCWRVLLLLIRILPVIITERVMSARDIMRNTPVVPMDAIEGKEK